MSFNKVRNYWAKYVRKTYKSVRKYRREKKAGLRNWLANGIGNKIYGNLQTEVGFHWGLA